MKVLIAYRSKYGTCEKAARMLAERIPGELVLADLKRDRPGDLSAFDMVLIGGSIYAGMIQKEVRTFCESRQEELLDRMSLLEMDPAFAERSVNDGFSGGEKKRNEILQLAMLKPALAVLDETDSGLDIDALKVVSAGVNALHEQDATTSFLMITHYQRILNYIRPDHVHVMVAGRIARSGGFELAEQLEAGGYETFRETAAV